MMLDPEQIRHFKTEGYLAIPDFFNRLETKALQTEIARFIDEDRLRNVATAADGITPTTGLVNMQMIPLDQHSDLFRAIPFCPRVRQSLSQLLGDPVVKILDQLFLKPARRGLPTNWHTDNAYFKIADPLQGTAMWIAIDDATQHNGTLKVIPRSFKKKFRHFRDPESDHHIRTEIDESRAVHCELNAGGVVFFAFGTPHATGPNPGPEDRTGVGIHFLNAAQLTGALTEGRRLMSNIQVTGEQAQGGQEKYGADYSARWDGIVAQLSSG